MVFKGVIDCSTNPNYPAADRGWTYRVSVAGKIGGVSGVNAEVGDLLLCMTDGTAAGDQATVGAQWGIGQSNIDGAVVGPASATDGNIATFNGAGGKIIKDSGINAVSLSTSTSTATSNIISLSTSTSTGISSLSTSTSTGISSLSTATSTSVSSLSTAIAGAGGGTPAGSGTELQYRNAGAFGAMSGTAWDDANRAETRTGATVTTSNPVQSFTQTWNAGAVAFTGWKMNVTNTASAATSKLVDLQVGGTSAHAVYANGKQTVYGAGNNQTIVIDPGTTNGYSVLWLLGNSPSGSNYFAQAAASGSNTYINTATGGAVIIGSGNAGALGAKGSTNVYFGQNTVVGWSSNADLGSGVGTLDTGYSRNAAGVVEINSGTAGTFRDLKLRNLLVQAGVVTLANFTVATLPSASTSGAGSLAMATDANATTNGSTVAAGGANKVVVKSDGTNWIILG